MKKKIGILTLQRSNNYGAMYQAYALSKYLEGLGHEVFILDYCMKKICLSEYLWSPVAFFRKIISKKMFTLKALKQKYQVRNEAMQLNLFDAIFDEFRDEHLNIVGHELDYKGLTDKHLKADVYICGSDQVWAVDFFFEPPAFLLGFAPSESKRVAYAASFGKSKLEPYMSKKFNYYLNKFDAVAVREKSGVDIVKDIAGLSATKVLDPTLLLDNYSEIIDYSLVPRGPYLLVYRLRQEERLADWMTDAIEKIACRQNLPIFSVSTNCPWSFRMESEKLQPTPGQLLGLIEQSSVFITNSFHGTVFSIILQVRFLAFARDVYEGKQNVRLIDLLTPLNLIDLYCPHFCEFEEIYEKFDSSYSYENVGNQLDKLRAISMDFLQKSIG